MISAQKLQSSPPRQGTAQGIMGISYVIDYGSLSYVELRAQSSNPGREKAGNSDPHWSVRFLTGRELALSPLS